MKNLFLTIFVFAIFICTCSEKPTLKTQLVQACIDNMYENKSFEHLGESPLVLIKNQFSKDLDALHFGGNKIILKEMPISEQNFRFKTLAKKDSAYFKVESYKIDKDRAVVGLYFPLLSYSFNLIKGDGNWIVKDFTVSSWDNLLTLPPHK